MNEPEQYILDGWDKICAKANKSLSYDCPLLEDAVLVEMHKYVSWLHREHYKLTELNGCLKAMLEKQESKSK